MKRKYLCGSAVHIMFQIVGKITIALEKLDYTQSQLRFKTSSAEYGSSNMHNNNGNGKFHFNNNIKTHINQPSKS